MPRMGRFPPFGKRFFRRARKLIGSCHFEHLWRIVTVLASLQQGHSLSKLEDAANERLVAEHDKSLGPIMCFAPGRSSMRGFI